MNKTKKQVRQEFREAVFKRDRDCCKVCGDPHDLDAHHIKDRHEMPGGGYVKENGIALCPDCHLKAEQFHMTGGESWEPGFHPDELYRKIGSSHEKALAACERL